MCSSAVKILLTLATGACGQLNAGSLNKQAPYGIRAAPPRFSPFYSSDRSSSVVAGAQKTEKEEAQQWIAEWRAKSQEPSNIGPMENSKLGFPNIGAPAPAYDPSGLTNVYGNDLKDCGKVGNCEYSENSPKICIGLAPRIREGGDAFGIGQEKPTSFKLTKSTLQSAWSDGYITQCIPIWDFQEDVTDSFMTWLTYGNQDLVPKCDALPSGVLQSPYSLQMWQNCEIEAREYKYQSPSSSNYGKGSEVTKKAGFVIDKSDGLGQERPEGFSARCARFRKVIKAICVGCELQTVKGDAKATLSGMCTSMETAPVEMSAETPEDSTSIGAVGLISFVVGAVLTFAVLRRRSSPAAAEPLLAASS